MMRSKLFSLLRYVRKAGGFALVLAAFAVPAYARIDIAPEIDPGSIGNALALLAGGVLMIKDWRGKRKEA
jgi:hypothetical protein